MYTHKKQLKRGLAAALALTVGLLPGTVFGAGASGTANNKPLGLPGAKPDISADQIAYVSSVAESFTGEPPGIQGFQGVRGYADVKAVVWLSELPAALESMYTALDMDVEGYAQARENAQSARESIRLMGETPANKGKALSPGIKITHEYTEIFSGFAVEATFRQIKKIAEIPGVYQITEDVMMEATGGGEEPVYSIQPPPRIINEN
jgi:hypothetical protein